MLKIPNSLVCLQLPGTHGMLTGPFSALGGAAFAWYFLCFLNLNPVINVWNWFTTWPG
jgi:hypothetical protein